MIHKITKVSTTDLLPMYFDVLVEIATGRPLYARQKGEIIPAINRSLLRSILRPTQSKPWNKRTDEWGILETKDGFESNNYDSSDIVSRIVRSTGLNTNLCVVALSIIEANLSIAIFYSSDIPAERAVLVPQIGKIRFAIARENDSKKFRAHIGQLENYLSDLKRDIADLQKQKSYELIFSKLNLFANQMLNLFHRRGSSGSLANNKLGRLDDASLSEDKIGYIVEFEPRFIQSRRTYRNEN